MVLKQFVCISCTNPVQAKSTYLCTERQVCDGYVVQNNAKISSPFKQSVADLKSKTTDNGFNLSCLSRQECCGHMVVSDHSRPDEGNSGTRTVNETFSRCVSNCSALN
jgi:hypothetical protein